MKGVPVRKRDRRYTYADYRRWPEEECWELIDGVGWNMSPPPSPRHQAAIGEIFIQVVTPLKGSLCRAFLAPFEVLLPESRDQREDDVPNVVRPDLTAVCDGSRISGWRCSGAPDWVVEVLSPWTMKKDLEVKFSLYERSGIPEYWLVDPGNRAFHIFRMESSGRYGDADIPFGGEDELPCPIGSGIVVRIGAVFAVAA